MLLAHGREPSLHLFVANLGAMRKQLFPSVVTAYQDWVDAGMVRHSSISAARSPGRALALRLLALHARIP